MSQNTSSSGCVSLGFFEVLALIFITLKILGLVDWSWWWVLSPVWITILFAVFVLTILYIVEK